MPPLDPETIKALITAATGSSVGTVLKSILQPETNLRRWMLQSISAIIVGVLFGLTLTEVLNFGTITSCTATAVGVLISENILSFVMKRGDKLKDGKIDISIEGDD
jgi:hypothetical protein